MENGVSVEWVLLSLAVAMICLAGGFIYLCVLVVRLHRRVDQLGRLLCSPEVPRDLNGKRLKERV